MKKTGGVILGSPTRGERSISLRPLILFFIVSFLGDLPALAQFTRLPDEQMVQFRLYPGLSETSPLYRQDAWIPIAIEVDNPSDRPIKGNLSLVASADSMGNFDDYTIEIPIQFAPSQRKMIRVLGRFPEWAEDLNLYLGRERVAIAGMREMDPTERVVVVLGEGHLEYNNLEVRQVIDQETIRSITIAHLSQSQILPDRVEGYETASLIVWDGMRMDPPTEEQNLGLRNFVELGGTLVLGLGDTGQRVHEFGWTDWVGELPTESRPIVIQGQVQTSGKKTAQDLLRGTTEWQTVSFALEEGSTTEGEVAFLSAEGTIPGEPCLLLDGEPLLYRKRLGAGTIFISRIPWSDWMKLGEPSIEFWKHFIKSLPDRPPTFSQDWDLLRPFVSYLRTSLLGELPGPLFIGGFLGLYTFLLIPVNYFFFRKRKRLELAWLLLPPLAIFFSYLAYHIGSLQQKGGIAQRHISVAFQPQGSSLARCQAMAAIYSPKRRVFEFQENYSRPLPLPKSKDNLQDLEEESLELRYLPEGTGGTYTPELRTLLVNHWASKELAYDTTVDLGGTIEAHAVEMTSQNLKVSVHNRTKFDFNKVFIVVETRFHDIGQLAKGESRTEDLTSIDRQTWNVLSQRLAGYSYPYNQNRQYFKMPLDKFVFEQGRSMIATFPIQCDVLGEKALDQYAPPHVSRRGVYALAETTSPLFPIEIGEEIFEREAVSLILTPVDVESDARDLMVGPTDWTVRTSVKSELLEQFVPDTNNNYYWNQLGIPENSMLPPPHEIGVFGVIPATATYILRPNLRNEWYSPISLSGETKKKEDPFRNRNNREFLVKWKGLHFQTGEWFEIPTEGTFEIPLDRGTLNFQQELILQLEISFKQEDGEDSTSRFTMNNYEPLILDLPELSMELQRNSD